jgi:hypothetical protein
METIFIRKPRIPMNVKNLGGLGSFTPSKWTEEKLFFQHGELHFQ